MEGLMRSMRLPYRANRRVLEGSKGTWDLEEAELVQTATPGGRHTVDRVSEQPD